MNSGREKLEKQAMSSEAGHAFVQEALLQPAGGVAMGLSQSPNSDAASDYRDQHHCHNDHHHCHQDHHDYR